MSTTQGDWLFLDSPPMTPNRVEPTSAAAELLHGPEVVHGSLLFHRSGGCFDGAGPTRFPRDDFRVCGRDIFLSDIESTPFYMRSGQCEYWNHADLKVDGAAGLGGRFSVEAPEGIRFFNRPVISPKRSCQRFHRCAEESSAQHLPMRCEPPQMTLEHQDRATAVARRLKSSSTRNGQ